MCANITHKTPRTPRRNSNETGISLKHAAGDRVLQALSAA
jgi:hypothetical protein